MTSADAVAIADRPPARRSLPTSYLARSDVELLRGSLRDPDAFGAFYDRHAARILAYFQRRTACPETAADLTAETFAAAFLSRRRFRDTGAPALAWLYVIAKRQLANLLRKEGIEDRARRRLGVEAIALNDSALERIEDLAELEPMLQRLEAARVELSPGSLEALRLRVEEELPYADIARHLDCSEGAARVRVARALTRLADSLEDAE